MKIFATLLLTLIIGTAGYFKKEVPQSSPENNLNAFLTELSANYPLTITLDEQKIDPRLLVYCDQPNKELILNPKFWVQEPFTQERKEILMQEFDFCWSVSQG